MKNKKRKGFTLIELLATIAIIAIIAVIVGFFAKDAIKNTKEKSYEVTLNEISSNANTYLTERKDLFFIPVVGRDDIEYQCITIENLVNFGYLKESITNSKVPSNDDTKDGENVDKQGYVYLERTTDAKTITKAMYVGVSSDKCDKAVKAQGKITFKVSPDGWQREKYVVITYMPRNLNDVRKISDYYYDYRYYLGIKEDPLEGLNPVEGILGKGNLPDYNDYQTEPITVIQDGYMLAHLIYEKDANRDTVGENYVKVTGIDRVGPKLEKGNYTGTNPTKYYAEIPLKVTDYGKGPKEDTLKIEDLVVSVGGRTVGRNESTKEKYELVYNGKDEENNLLNYTLKLTHYEKNGEVVLTVEAGKMFDGLNNPNDESTLPTGVNFLNTYTVNFDGNGGTPSKASTTVTYGGKYDDLATVTATRTGYTLEGWYTEASGGSKIDTNTDVTITGTQTLYAHWTPNTYTITFDKNGGNEPNPTSKTVTYDKTYGALASTSRTGYTFTGWYTSSGALVESTTKVLITSNQTLYAHWNVNTYTVSYNSNGGSACSSFTVTYGGNITSLCTPTRSGYTFLGWYYAGGFDATWYSNQYSDLKAAFGLDATKLKNHWKQYGIKEGRLGSSSCINVGTSITSYKYNFTSNVSLVAQWEQNPSSGGGGGGGGGGNSCPAGNCCPAGCGCTGHCSCTQSCGGSSSGNSGNSGNSGGNSCFVSGTKVMTPNGEKKIEELKPNDIVYSRNEVTGALESDIIATNFERLTMENIYEIYTKDNKIEVTPKHPFYVKDKGYIMVKELKIGDILLDINNNEVKILDIKIRANYSGIKVYNLQVTNNHNYFVSDDSVLVHNKACFLAGTKVSTISGYKDIDKMQVGDMVLSYNEETGKNEYKQVIEVFTHKNVKENLYTLTIDGKELKVTEYHRFYIKNEFGDSWIAAKDLKVGDKVMYSDKTYHRIDAISYELQTNTVYNLSVLDNHNYYVGDERILVHNRKDDTTGDGSTWP